MLVLSDEAMAEMKAGVDKLFHESYLTEPSDTSGDEAEEAEEDAPAMLEALLTKLLPSPPPPPLVRDNRCDEESAAAAADDDTEKDKPPIYPRPTPTYNPHEFQRPHPDDRSGPTGGTAKGSGSKGKVKNRSTTISSCANCNVQGANMRCGQCSVVTYCGEKCQEVSEQSWRGQWRRRAREPAMMVVGANVSRQQPPFRPRSTGTTVGTRAPARPTSSPLRLRRSSSVTPSRRSRPSSA